MLLQLSLFSALMVPWCVTLKKVVVMAMMTFVHNCESKKVAPTVHCKDRHLAYLLANKTISWHDDCCERFAFTVCYEILL